MGNGIVKGNQIEDEIRQDELKSKRTVKLIMLGSGESGKSTLVRQMKILKLNGFTPHEDAFYREHIYRNLAESVVLLSQALEQANMEYCESVADAIDVVKAWLEYSDRHHLEFAEEIALAIRTVLNDNNIASFVAEGRHEKLVEMPDSGSYFFENHLRITQPTYIPDNDDIVRCRVATTGVHEIRFSIEEITFRIIDVGGQRGQRRKWIHHFENVHGMLFVTALCDYYRTMLEDNTVNRMSDSIEVFRGLLATKVFAKTAVLVFFNKKDVFVDKLNLYPLSMCFPGADNICDYEAAKHYICEKFLEVKPIGKMVYAHFTNATDRRNTKAVLDMTFDVIIKQNVRKMGML